MKALGANITFLGQPCQWSYLRADVQPHSERAGPSGRADQTRSMCGSTKLARAAAFDSNCNGHPGGAVPFKRSFQRNKVFRFPALPSESKPAGSSSQQVFFLVVPARTAWSIPVARTIFSPGPPLARQRANIPSEHRPL
jgi:hypothetical protein